jgi:chromosome segregation ATPase
LEASLEDRNQHIQSLEGEVAEVRNTIAEKDERIKNLEGEVQGRVQYINDLNTVIRDKDEKISNLEGEINKILQRKSIRLHRKIEEVLRRMRIRQRKD